MTSQQQVVRPRNKARQAYDDIRARIMSRQYSPGYRLVLSRVAAELGMSVVPVREAIRQLEAEGLVTFEPNVGAHVSMVDDTQYRHSMETLSILEGAATAMAVPAMTQADVESARRVNEQMKAMLDEFDPSAFTGLNREFHTLLVARCVNPRMLELVEGEWERLAHLRDSTFSFVPGRASVSVAEHEQILTLIEKGSPVPEIEDAVRRHQAATLQAYLEHRGTSAPDRR